MRSYRFETPSEQIREELFEQLFNFFKEWDAFALRDIMLMKWSDKEKYIVAFAKADCIKDTVSITAYNKKKDGGVHTEVLVDSEFFPYELRVPNSVKISVEWAEDTVNRYKIVKTNFDEIKGMAQQGVGVDVIGQTFGINWSEEDSRKILEKDKI